MVQYKNSLKKTLCEKICIKKDSTIKIAQKYNIPLKTLEKWITAYNKNPHIFDEEIEYNDFSIISDYPINSVNIDYDSLSLSELKEELMKKDIEIARLKKTIK